MKYIVVLADGMADRPLASLNGKTPIMAAYTPCIDDLAALSQCGLARTLYDDLPTGSDTANLSVLGYDPHLYYTGRSPIEALGLGIPIDDDDLVFRLNLVTVSDDIPFSSSVMLDHSAGKIENDEAFALIEALRAELNNLDIRIFPGVSYRHILLWKNYHPSGDLTPPHDILGQRITNYLPEAPVLEIIERGNEILSAHPVNKKRRENGQNAANCMWLWGAGTKPKYPSFANQFGLKGAVITAVPLISGLAAGMGMTYIPVEGATGEYNTNYIGKAKAALEALETNDFVFIHIEAPDECGHDGDAVLKTKSIERIDREVLSVLRDGLEERSLEYKLLLMPDHATPVDVRTHTTDPVPYLIYDSRSSQSNTLTYSESGCSGGLYFDDAYKLMPYFIK